MRVAAIVLAGGSGTRVRGQRNKPYLSVSGRPLIWYPLKAFDRSGVETVVLVIRPVDDEAAREVVAAVGSTKVVSIVAGGPTRTDSEHAGLAALERAEADVIMIHDAARPFVTPTMIDCLASTAHSVGGAVPVLDPPVTPWRLIGENLQPVPGLVRAQTPQAFRAEALREAYRRAAEVEAVGADTVEIVERFGEVDVAAVDGDPRTFKVTHPEDLATAEAVAMSWISELGTAPR